MIADRWAPEREKKAIRWRAVIWLWSGGCRGKMMSSLVSCPPKTGWCKGWCLPLGLSTDRSAYKEAFSKLTGDRCCKSRLKWFGLNGAEMHCLFLPRPRACAQFSLKTNPTQSVKEATNARWYTMSLGRLLKRRSCVLSYVLVFSCPISTISLSPESHR